MNIISKKYIYFLISLVVIIPGIVSLFFYHLHPSIDFTGGSRFTLVFPRSVSSQMVGEVKEAAGKDGIKIGVIQQSGNQIIIRTAPVDEKQNTKFTNDLHGEFGPFSEADFETVGPVIGNETTLNALKAVVVAAFLIVLYIAWSFRKVPKPASSWRFGVCAIAALLHDVLVLLGVFSILGHFFGVEVDSLFVTAVLTVIGFSVHDTIVVFDRIRENLRRMSGAPFAHIVNDSILQTLGRSLNTSLTVLLVLFTLLLFGGETIRWFVVALLVGIVSGTYSSIFNAAPLLVLWQEWEEKKNIKLKTQS